MTFCIFKAIMVALRDVVFLLSFFDSIEFNHLTRRWPVDSLKDVLFYLFISAFVAVCLLKPNLIIGFRKKDGNAKSKEGAKNKEVI